MVCRSCELVHFCSSSNSFNGDFHFKINEVDFESDILSSQIDMTQPLSEQIWSNWKVKKEQLKLQIYCPRNDKGL